MKQVQKINSGIIQRTFKCQSFNEIGSNTLNITFNIYDRRESTPNDINNNESKYQIYFCVDVEIFYLCKYFLTDGMCGFSKLLFR